MYAGWEGDCACALHTRVNHAGTAVKPLSFKTVNPRAVANNFNYAFSAVTLRVTAVWANALSACLFSGKRSA